MQKSTLPVGVKTLKGWAEKGTLVFDNPVQRSGGQWSLLQRSLLIHSLLAGYPIPNCYFMKAKSEEGETQYDCLDSKQRLNAIFDFIDGGYSLHASTPEIELDGTVYDLANLTFDELSDECKDEILGYRFSIYALEDASEEEIEEIFARLNNSTPLTPIQKCRAVLGTELARWVNTLCEKDFFNHSVSLTVAQLRRECILEVILQSLLLLDARHEGFEYKGISTSEVTRYCKHIRGNYNEDKRDMVEGILEYLGESFPDTHRFLKKSNLPMVVVLAKLALENDIEPADFKQFIDSFANAVVADYEANMGSGNTKVGKTQGRLVAICNQFEKYFELEGLNILSVEEEISEEEVDEYEEGEDD